MPILALQHHDIGTPGRLGVCLRDHGFSIEVARPDQPVSRFNRAVPADLDGIDGLLILGGPQNVTDAAQHAWMQAELALIKAAHARELPIIGICLGAQLIAHALGGQVGPKDRCAAGFSPVSLNMNGQTETIFAGIAWNHPQYFSCGQEVKALPPGAAALASSAHTKFAAFRAGVRTYAFQYHFECDVPMLEALTAASKREAESAGLTTGEIKVQIDQQYAAYARLSDRLCVNIATYCFPLERRISA